MWKWLDHTLRAWSSWKWDATSSSREYLYRCWYAFLVLKSSSEDRMQAISTRSIPFDETMALWARRASCSAIGDIHKITAFYIEDQSLYNLTIVNKQIQLIAVDEKIRVLFFLGLTIKWYASLGASCSGFSMGITWAASRSTSFSSVIKLGLRSSQQLEENDMTWLEFIFPAKLIMARSSNPHPASYIHASYATKYRQHLYVQFAHIVTHAYKSI